MHRNLAEKTGGPQRLRVSIKLKAEAGGKVIQEAAAVQEARGPISLRSKIDAANQGLSESVLIKCDGRKLQVDEKVSPAPQKAAQNDRLILVQFGLSAYLCSTAVRGVALETCEHKSVRVEKFGEIETQVLEYGS